MAQWTQATVGNVVTYTVMDAGSNTGTIAVTKNAVTGFTTALSASALHNDGLQVCVELLQLISTGLLPNAAVNAPGSFS